METVYSGLLYIDRNSVLVIYKINLTEALSPNLTFAIYTANIIIMEGLFKAPTMPNKG